MSWTVLPRPMSSARQPPRPSEVIRASQSRPRSWYARRLAASAAGCATVVSPSWAVSRVRRALSQGPSATGTCSPPISAYPVRATARASTAVSGGSARFRAFRASAGPMNTWSPRTGTTGRPAPATASDSSSVSGSPSRQSCQRRSTVPSSPRKARMSAGGVRSRPTTARALSRPPVPAGQCTGTPCARNRAPAPPSSSTHSSSVRSMRRGTGSSRASGSHRVAARRTARTVSAWARGPSRWGVPSKRSEAVTSTVGSARSDTRGTRWGADVPSSPSPSRTESAIRTPVSTPTAISSAQARRCGTCWGAAAANAARPVAASAAGVRGRVSATASRKARSRRSAGGRSPLPGAGTARASGGAAAASSRSRRMSAGSSGPTRQASWSPSDTPGRSRSRAVRWRARARAAPQKAAASWTPSSPYRRRASARTGSASPTDSHSTGASRSPWAVTRPVSDTSVPGEASASPLSDTTVPGAAGRTPPSGSQNASRPVRGGSAGSKATAYRASRPASSRAVHTMGPRLRRSDGRCDRSGTTCPAIRFPPTGFGAS
ncbi:hypothetical protein GA0115252_122625 [Streptomyces sp. DfronAA-171]|nr:hypothetical protein GA0115252_122625 [Streptomyces sp. DfronAA-171]